MLKRMLDMDMGEVRIGASDMTLQFFLLPYLEQFHKEYPKIKVTVTNAPTTGDHPLPGRRQDRLWCGNNAIFRSWSYPQYRGKSRLITYLLQEAALKNCREGSWTIPFSVICPVSFWKKIPAPACLWISFYPRKALN